MRSRHLSRVIDASPEAVYRFAADPDNLPLWATGLASTDVTRDGDDLLVDSPMGAVTVRFVPRNDFGILDHDVILPSGTVVTNPIRVIAHPDGAEVIFTIRQFELSNAEFDRDTGMVEDDLDRLKSLLESRRTALPLVDRH